MDAPTIIVGLIILALCLAIVGRGVYNRTRRRGARCVRSGWRKARHLHRFIDVQRAGLSVRSDTAEVINTVGCV